MPSPPSVRGVGAGREGTAAADCHCSCHSKIGPSAAAEHVPIPCHNGIKTENTAFQNGMKTQDCPGGEMVEKEVEEEEPARVAAVTSGSGGDGGMKVMEVDEDFRCPKKRYRAPGRASLVRVRVHLLS